MSKISVIVPVYNVEKYLKKCVDSIINQTYKNLEIILVDDGSTDNCPIICDEYDKLDNRIKVIHKENGGQASSRNMALDIASGEYIAFVDSDDYIELNMYEALYSECIKYDCDIAICGYKLDNGLKLNMIRHITERRIYKTHELMLSYLTDPFVNTVMWNKLYKKKLFHKLRFPLLRSREDAYIMHTLLDRCNEAVIVPDRFYIQLLRTDSTEQKAFSIEKLGLIEYAINLQKYIRENRPSLYNTVAFKVANARILIMKDIVCSFKYNEYLKLFKEQRNFLKDEINKLHSYKNSNPGEYKKVIFVYNHNLFFIMQSLINGFNKKIKNIIRRIFRIIKF